MQRGSLLLPLSLLSACSTAGALKYFAQTDAGSTTADATCDGTVSFVFLARQGLPLERVWRKFLDGCRPGSYTVHIHSQQGGEAPLLPEAQWVADPVMGELRKNITMQQAMHKLYRDASRATAPNGCQPRWAQMLSESCAPLRGCAEYQDFLTSHPGTSFLESWPCTVGARADACYCRMIAGWKTTWYKAHQWSTLWMDHARMLLANEDVEIKRWSHTRVPDEHFTINLLDAGGANHTAFGLTHVYPFMTGRKGHPGDIDCGNKTVQRGHVSFNQSVQDVVSAGRVFSRKFENACVDSLLANLPDPAAAKP
mmetsp:Transcript_44167/g.137537  ORF Transcript_44167/g.137537 Transcript_44167/m.137537 type:complete len:311 (+) Transcript_44167:65-997(+)